MKYTILQNLFARNHLSLPLKEKFHIKNRLSKLPKPESLFLFYFDLSHQS